MTGAGRGAVGIYVAGGLVGDMLNMLPVIRTLRGHFPGRAIRWLTGRGGSALAGVLGPLAAPYIDAFVDDAAGGARHPGLVRRILPDERFEVLIDCQSRVITTLALRRVPHRVFVSAAARFTLSDRRPPGRRRPAAVLERFAQLVELASGQPCRPDFRVELPAELRALAARRLPEGPCYVGLAPGAGDSRKCWPRARFAALARLQLERGRVPVFFLGPRERDWLAGLAAEVPAALFPEWRGPGAIEGSPLLTIALAERVSAAVANDCGTGHMLGAGRTALVTLFGHTAAPKFAVRSARRWLGVSAAEFGGSTPEAIPLEAVAAALERVLAP